MAQITFKGNPIHTNGELPAVGSQAPAFTLTGGDLADVDLGGFSGKKKLLNIVPSLDTPVCAVSTRRFNEYAAGHQDTVMLMVSADLPFAQGRFCTGEKLDNVVPLSAFRSDFVKDYGVLITDSPLAGLAARAVVVMDENNKVLYTELVPEIGEEPDYQSALAALG